MKRPGPGREATYGRCWAGIATTGPPQRAGAIVSSETGSETDQECPDCGRRSATPIGYGYPSHEMFEAAERGELVLGGCLVEPASPIWCCARCGRKWGVPPSTIDGIAAFIPG